MAVWSCSVQGWMVVHVSSATGVPNLQIPRFHKRLRLGGIAIVPSQAIVEQACGLANRRSQSFTSVSTRDTNITQEQQQ